MRHVVGKARYFSRMFVVYYRETESLGEYLRLLQVRFALSRFVGRFICPKPVAPTIRIRSFGGPVLLRSHTTDISVANELLMSHSYEHIPDVVSEPPSSIVDLGANIGLASRWLAVTFPTATITAVEPDPGNLSVLKANLAEIADRSTCWPVAVGSEPGTAQLRTDSGEHGFSIVGSATETGVEVDVVTMRHVLDSSGIRTIDILKCDIEGAERLVFADCDDWIRSVRVIEVECHEPYRLADLFDDLARNGASFEMIDHQPNPDYHCETALLRNRQDQQALQALV